MNTLKNHILLEMKEVRKYIVDRAIVYLEHKKDTNPLLVNKFEEEDLFNIGKDLFPTTDYDQQDYNANCYDLGKYNGLRFVLSKIELQEKYDEEHDYDHWIEKFNPKINKISSHISEYEGYMFETYGEELIHVKKQKNHYIWTLIEGEGNNMYISPGYHFVNRMGYFITTVPWVNEDEDYIME